MTHREQDLGKLSEEVGAMLRSDGANTSRTFADWKRNERIPQTPPACGACDGMGKLYAYGGIGEAVACPECEGTGDGARVGGNPDGKLDRQASRKAADWLHTRIQLEYHLNRAKALMGEAKHDKRVLLDKHRTPAQVEADGWCGHHWRLIGELEAITLRPTGEPFYRGKCRWCGDNNPDADMLRARHNGRALKVRA